MAISRKHRRPISVGGRDYLWWVFEDLESAGAMTLSVASADGRFQVRYALHQPEDSLHLTILGKDFPGLPAKRRSTVRVQCPRLASEGAVTPADVRRVIEWCLGPHEQLVQVAWPGFAV